MELGSADEDGWPQRSGDGNSAGGFDFGEPRGQCEADPEADIRSY